MLHVPVTGTGMEHIVKVINFICYLLEIKNEEENNTRIFAISLADPRIIVNIGCLFNLDNKKTYIKVE